MDVLRIIFLLLLFLNVFHSSLPKLKNNLLLLYIKFCFYVDFSINMSKKKKKIVALHFLWVMGGNGTTVNIKLHSLYLTNYVKQANNRIAE